MRQYIIYFFIISLSFSFAEENDIFKDIFSSQRENDFCPEQSGGVSVDDLWARLKNFFPEEDVYFSASKAGKSKFNRHGYISILVSGVSGDKFFVGGFFDGKKEKLSSVRIKNAAASMTENALIEAGQDNDRVPNYGFCFSSKTHWSWVVIKEVSAEVFMTANSYNISDTWGSNGSGGERVTEADNIYEDYQN